MIPDAWICSMGMVTAVGGCAAQTAASVRAGVSGFVESAIFDKHFRPMTLALVPDEALPPLASSLESEKLTMRQARMLRLALPALQEALSAVSVEQPLRLFLALPAEVPERPTSDSKAFLESLQTQCDVALDLGGSQVFQLLKPLDVGLQGLAACSRTGA